MDKILEFGKAHKDGELLSYVCPFCGYTFKNWVRTFNKITTQINCPACKNNIKTRDKKSRKAGIRAREQG